MPIKIPNDLPAVQTLADENIFVMTETRAITQDIRPLKIVLLNLMPKKIETETQLSRMLGNTPLQIELTLIRTSSHVSQNTAQQHLLDAELTEITDTYDKIIGVISLYRSPGGGYDPAEDAPAESPKKQKQPRKRNR